MTLYAHWQEGITVHFDGNGYKGTISDKTVRKDAVGKNLPTCRSTATRQQGARRWYTAKEGGERVTQDTVFTESEITLHAHWRDYQYQVEFNVRYSDKSSVTGEMATVAVPFGVDYKLPACTFQREATSLPAGASRLMTRRSSMPIRRPSTVILKTTTGTTAAKTTRSTSSMPSGRRMFSASRLTR